MNNPLSVHRKLLEVERDDEHIKLTTLGTDGTTTVAQYGHSGRYFRNLTVVGFGHEFEEAGLLTLTFKDEAGNKHTLGVYSDDIETHVSQLKGQPGEVPHE